MDKRKKGVKWLNFLYSFFGLEIIVKGYFAIGTISTIVAATRGEDPESLFSVANFVSLCACILLIVEVVFKLLACISHTKAEGYSAMIWALVTGVISSVFYMFADQGWLTGLVFSVFAIGFFAINFVYVRNRKWIFGNADYL